jgi:hypothetical protein
MTSTLGKLLVWLNIMWSRYNICKNDENVNICLVSTDTWYTNNLTEFNKISEIQIFKVGLQTLPWSTSFRFIFIPSSLTRPLSISMKSLRDLLINESLEHSVLIWKANF